MEVSAKSVFEIIHGFFVAASGADNEVKDAVLEDGERQSLLRTACMGNPERTMQGELFAYLKSHLHLRPVLEYRYHRLAKACANASSSLADVGNSIDIMVFDRSYHPIVAVELKHHSRQQGTLHRLKVTLGEDRDRLSTLDVPSIQVGLYTELQSLGHDQDSRELYEDFRFITAYAFHEGKDGGHKWKLRRKSNSIEPSELCTWAKDHFDELKHSFRGRAERFKTRNGAIVEGRVHYLIGLNYPRSQTKSSKLPSTGRNSFQISMRVPVTSERFQD